MVEAKRRSRENDDGDENGSNEGRAKRAKTTSNDPVADRLIRLEIFLEQLRQEVAAKATAARQATIPGLIKQLRRLLNRLENLSDQIRVLLDEVPAAMEAMIVCTHDLMQWIALAQPPMSTGGSCGPLMQEKEEKIVEIEKDCILSLAMIPDYHLARGLIAQQFRNRPQSSEECRKELEAYDRANAKDWKHRAEVLLDGCEWLANFVDSHRQFIEDTDAQKKDDDDANNMYR